MTTTLTTDGPALKWLADRVRDAARANPHSPLQQTAWIELQRERLRATLLYPDGGGTTIAIDAEGTEDAEPVLIDVAAFHRLTRAIRRQRATLTLEPERAAEVGWKTVTWRVIALTVGGATLRQRLLDLPDEHLGGRLGTGGATVRVPSAQLARVLGVASSFAPKEIGEQEIKTPLVRIADGAITVQATDGHRAVRLTVPGRFGDEAAEGYAAIAPRYLATLARSLRRAADYATVTASPGGGLTVAAQTGLGEIGQTIPRSATEATPAALWETASKLYGRAPEGNAAYVEHTAELVAALKRTLLTAKHGEAKGATAFCRTLPDGILIGSQAPVGDETLDHGELVDAVAYTRSRVAIDPRLALPLVEQTLAISKTAALVLCFGADPTDPLRIRGAAADVTADALIMPINADAEAWERAERDLLEPAQRLAAADKAVRRAA